MKFQTPEVSGRRPLKIELRLRAAALLATELDGGRVAGWLVADSLGGGEAGGHLGAHTETWQ